jgi:hypothetical protein
MKSRIAAPLLALALTGCLQDSPTDAGFEARVFSALGGLRPGETLTLTGEAAQTIFLPGGAEGNEFVYIPFFAADEGSARLQVEVTGEGLGAAPAAALLGGGASALGVADLAASEDPFHLRVQRWNREHANRWLRAPGTGPARQRLLDRQGAAAVPAPGSTITLRAPNFNQAGSPCDNPLIREARVAAVGERSIVAADLQNPAQLTDAQFQQVAEEFDRLVYPVNIRNFGEPTDIDNNDRVIIFFTSVVNQLTMPEDEGFVGGFFFGADLFPRSAPGQSFQCAASNEGEIFYILAPDPAGVLGRTQPRDRVARSATGTVGHEFQHLINLGRRILNNAQSAEEVWLNEGLSHIAEELLFYETTTFEPRQNITVDQIRAAQSAVQPFLRFQAQNLLRYANYLEDPDEESLLGIDNLPTRGASWAFLRYAADREPGEDPDFFRALVNSRVAGIANLANVIDDNPIDWMQDWTVSVYADDLPVEVDPRFTQPSWNYRSVLTAFFQGDFPLELIPLGTNGRVNVTLRGGGAAFVRVRAAPGGTAVIRTTSAGAVPPERLRVSVVRAR